MWAPSASNSPSALSAQALGPARFARGLDKNLIFVAKTRNYGIFVAKTRNYGIFVAKIYDYALIDSF